MDKLAILKIIIFTILFLLLFSYLIIYHYREYILNNWSYYKSNPVIILFSGFLRKDGEKKSFFEFTGHNFKSWLWGLFKTFLNI